MNKYHTTVLLKEAIEGLNVIEGAKYIDGTLGGGGHTQEILERGGKVLGIDSDKDAIEHVKEILRDKDIKIKSDSEDENHNILVSQYPTITLVRGNFKDIGMIAQEHGFGEVSGVLFDLGVSGHQLDVPERGFSIRGNGPLDMRMDNTLSVTARDLVNGLSKKELQELFFKLGEERYSRPVADAIVKKRLGKMITTTDELKEIVERVVRFHGEGVHPATRIFQALRIVVNDELHSLRNALPQALALLNPKGRLAVISFHSLEDRIVKEFFVKSELEGIGKIMTKKPIISSDEEVSQNPRSRSAKLRLFEKGEIL